MKTVGEGCVKRSLEGLAEERGMKTKDIFGMEKLALHNELMWTNSALLIKKISCACGYCLYNIPVAIH